MNKWFIIINTWFGIHTKTMRKTDAVGQQSSVVVILYMYKCTFKKYIVLHLQVHAIANPSYPYTYSGNSITWKRLFFLSRLKPMEKK